ncbi:MAG: CAP domain-containing protein [Candidatus Shapirobacteria bacterium]|jgi:uncharacterized protein YkwD
MKKFLKVLFVLIMIVVISIGAYLTYKGISYAKTKTSDFIVDEANILDDRTKQYIISMIDAGGYKGKIGVVITKSTKPLTIKEYATKIDLNWVMEKNFSRNGVIIFYAVDDPNFLVQHSLTSNSLINLDQAQKIIEISTSFIRNSQNSEAIVQGVKATIDLASGKELSPIPTSVPETTPTSTSTPTKTGKQPLPVLKGSSIFSFVNQYRASKGLPFLSVSDELCKLAEKRADLMMANNMEAFKKSGTGNHYQFDDVQYSGNGVGENIAANLGRDKDVVEKWKTSPPHNELMLWTEKEGTQITKGCVATRVSEVGSIVVLLVGDK